MSARRRCQVVASARNAIAGDAETLIDLCRSDQRTDAAETISAELIPLCDALRFIGRRGPGLLRDQRLGLRGRPIWMLGVSSRIQRVPLGDVLILAAWNYPLLLPGVQTAQALAAGNRVWLKPAPGCEAVTARLSRAFWDVGVPEDQLRLLDASPETAAQRIAEGVDLIILTGASTTGQAVLRQSAETITPCVMELSGCDAVIIGPGADLDRVAEAVRFGLLFNAGATCIGPRRILVSKGQWQPLIDRLRLRLNESSPVALHPAARQAALAQLKDTLFRGGVDLLGHVDTELLEREGRMAPVLFGGVEPDWPIAASDLFAPIASVMTYENEDRLVDTVNECPYRLAASIFGESHWSGVIASRLDLGHVSIGDMILPTADPRVPFGGTGRSGFGVTRGAEGLLAMTRPRVVARHRGRFFPHLRPRQPRDASALVAILQLGHAPLWQKWGALRRLMRAS